jgi:uncharacterized protein YjbI with pentapeptide repeats
MADPEHLDLISKGVSGWNRWRSAHLDAYPDLSGAHLAGAQLAGAQLNVTSLNDADLRGADLSGSVMAGAQLVGAKLAGSTGTKANLWEANCRGADFQGARFSEADFRYANLTGANLTRADLSLATLSQAMLVGSDLTGANLKDADLQASILVRTTLNGANLNGCAVYGASVWDVKTDEGTRQTGLIISPADESPVIVDDLGVAQFFYLLLDREKIRDVIDAVTRRGVLLLGRFGDGGLALLQALAGWLRKPENGGYLPLLFDFPRPESKTYTETIRTLAGLARFVIVDLSGPSVPQEITATVDLYEIPFVPILEQKREDWSMFRDFLVKERVLEPIRFTDQDHLIGLLAEEGIAPAERLIEKRQQRLDKIFRRT